LEETFSVPSVLGLYNEELQFNWKSQLRAAVVKFGRLIAEAGDRGGTQRRGTSAFESRYQRTTSEY
jgi:hypothetical protein